MGVGKAFTSGRGHFFGVCLGALLLFAILIGGCSDASHQASLQNKLKPAEPVVDRASSKEPVPSSLGGEPTEPVESRKSGQKKYTKPSPDVVIQAKNLFAAYEQNEVAADESYKGREFVVEGTVDKIGKDILDKPYILFKTENLFMGVQCLFTEKDNSDLAYLRPGEIRTIKGICRGKMINVIMDNCEFVHVKTELEIKEENKVQRREIQKQENEEKRAHTYIVRTWTDNTGKFSVDAEFNGMSFGKVQLKKNDGKIIKIDLEKLSDEDREWIKTEK